jgi:hypothetical protein
MRDGQTPVDIDAGFEVAPGDANDIEVTNAHAWGSNSLIFSDGAYCNTQVWIAQDPARKGMGALFSIKYCVLIS